MIERREVLDGAGELVRVEVWEDGVPIALWSAEFDNALLNHPALKKVAEELQQKGEL